MQFIGFHSIPLIVILHVEKSKEISVCLSLIVNICLSVYLSVYLCLSPTPSYMASSYEPVETKL